MALPASGTISLNQMHIEAGGSSGTLCSINDADIRGLTPGTGYSIPTGSGTAIDFADFYGASSRGEIVFTNTGTSAITTSWTAPFTGTVSVLCLGAGSDGGVRTAYDGGVGGGGGASAWITSHSITAGQVYTIRVPCRAQYGTGAGKAVFKKGSTRYCEAISATKPSWRCRRERYRKR